MLAILVLMLSVVSHVNSCIAGLRYVNPPQASCPGSSLARILFGGALWCDWTEEKITELRNTSGRHSSLLLCQLSFTGARMWGLQDEDSWRSGGQGESVPLAVRDPGERQHFPRLWSHTHQLWSSHHSHLSSVFPGNQHVGLQNHNVTLQVRDPGHFWPFTVSLWHKGAL